MQRLGSVVARWMAVGELPGWSTRRGLRLAVSDYLRGGPSGARGPDKFRLLDMKRRRAQIRARRELGLS